METWVPAGFTGLCELGTFALTLGLVRFLDLFNLLLYFSFKAARIVDKGGGRGRGKGTPTGVQGPGDCFGLGFGFCFEH